VIFVVRNIIMSALITVSFTVGFGCAVGDYVQLHGNSGSGAIDWETPLTDHQFDLFPDGAGYYGYGHTPYGRTPYGRGQSIRTPGYGHLPCGHHPYGHGAVVITASTIVTMCGSYIFGFAAFDSAGNAHAGAPGEVTVAVHIAPPPPTPLTFNAYNQTTQNLTLDAA